MNTATAFTWTTHAAGAALITRCLHDIQQRCAWTANFAKRLLAETATRLEDWIDHLEVPAKEFSEATLRQAGFTPAAGDHWFHQGGRLPSLHRGSTRRCFLHVGDVSQCCAALAISTDIIGEAGPGLRKAKLATGDDCETWCVSRLGYNGFTDARNPPATVAALQGAMETLRMRRRDWDDDAKGFAHTLGLLRTLAKDLGPDTLCDLFFACERERWERRNRAAAHQRWRQDRLGLGWGNHDHHTFRSSRQSFAPLIACLEAMGMVCRERFHAGAEAGWGAQVLEHPITGIVVFADVDLSPDEIANDPGHEGLTARKDLGTVGLWCALHGESFFQAGLHHLACLGDFDLLRSHLDHDGVTSMKPFTNFPYLRQCFTDGEAWAVAPQRLKRLVDEGRLDQGAAERIAREGGRGSHLELIERNEAFKGFNQHGVSVIIAATDPRK